MQAYYSIVLQAVPAFVLLLAAEAVALWLEEREGNKNNLKAGIWLVLGGLPINFVLHGIPALLFGLLYQYRLFEFAAEGWLVWLLCFFGDDLSYYWYHRCSHQVRFLWASHKVHHSAEEFTLAGGLRVPWTSQLTGTFLFWSWMPLIGIPPYMVFLFQTSSVIYQFWLHTEYIKRMAPWFEFIFNTPSHHRVHHACNVEYLDKNHAGTLIIWDRIFGTYQEETIRPVFGLTENIGSHHPVTIAAHEWKAVFADLRKARNLHDKLHYLFDSPGWSPDGSSLTTRQLQRKEFVPLKILEGSTKPEIV